MEANKGQKFEFDERFAVVEFATPGSVRLSVCESRLASADPERFPALAGLKHNPHVGFVDIHYPTDGGRPVFVRMDLEERWCDLEYATSLYAILANELRIPIDAPCEIHMSQKAKTVVLEHGDSRFCEIPCYTNKDTFGIPDELYRKIEKGLVERRLKRSNAEPEDAGERG